MLAAIEEARSTIGLSTYIFDNDRSRRFSLSRRWSKAVQRGDTQVRVLIDISALPQCRPSRRIPCISPAFRREEALPADDGALAPDEHEFAQSS